MPLFAGRGLLLAGLPGVYWVCFVVGVCKSIRMKEKLRSNMSKEKSHHRNVGPMLSSPRCGARTRSGKPCMAPAGEKHGVGCIAF
jgi:hypothetical protein